MERCPICGTSEIRLIGGFRKRMFGKQVSKFQWRCKRCGKQWTIRTGASGAAIRLAAQTGF